MTFRSRTSFLFAVLFVVGCLPAVAAEPEAASQSALIETAAAFDGQIRPLLKQYCLGCHSTKEKKGELDLERFTSLDDLRRDVKPWLAVIEMLDAGEMPPKEKPQPSAEQRQQLLGWTRRFIDAEARSRAGDPGPVLLRRLSNAEYDCTIRDLTGVDLRPAREFPADGAAGEGFTNAADALNMSPALLHKYLDAAKGMTDHLILLPDGFRFSKSAHQRDWVDEVLTELHGIYGQYGEPSGQLPLRRYLNATVTHRAALAADPKAFAAVAKQENLSAKYLETLWQTLNEGRPSLLLDDVRARWKTATPADVPALTAEIENWQKLVWKLENDKVAYYGNWQYPNPEALVESQSFKVKMTPAPGQREVVLYLVAKTIGDTSQKSQILWDKPRFEADKQPVLSLRDVRAVARQLDVEARTRFKDTAKYLAVAAQWQRPDNVATLEAVAKEQGIDAGRLQRWVTALGISKDVPLPLSLLTKKLENVAGKAVVRGWCDTTPDSLPALFTNASDQTVTIPGTIPPHGVTVHPTPNQFVAVAWNSPVKGPVRIEAKVSDAHAGCGNGVGWWLEVRRGDRRQELAAGEFDDGKAAQIDPHDATIGEGDIVCLAINARNHEHTCDLTLIDLTITEINGQHRSWNLSTDVADNVLDGNPHADRQGRKDAWRFVKGPDTDASQHPLPLPAGSRLAKWRDALTAGASSDELAKLAQDVESLLTAPPAAATSGNPDTALVAALNATGSPLSDPIDLARLLKMDAASAPSDSPFGLDPARFGHNPSGKAIDAASFTQDVPSVLEIRLPSALVAGREFVVDGRLDSAADSDALVQLQVLTAPPAKDATAVVAAPALSRPQAKQRQGLEQSMNEFRQTFPLMLSYSQIVPTAPDGITLRLFYREDEPLCRLMLDDAGRQRLDRLWQELRYISRDALQIQDSFDLFIGFASQVGKVPEFEPHREPTRVRAEQFKQELLASEPNHLRALVDFAARAYRRPLSAAEQTELLDLYQTLRKKEVSHEDALRGVLTRVLCAPTFLYRLEQQPPGKAAQPLNDWELASRLSYFLWSSVPDDELRELATAGRLHEPPVLAAQTRRMLKDDRVRGLAIEFGTQWIHVRGFDQIKDKNEHLFPTFDDTLRTAINEESIRFFQELFQGDRALTDVLDADYTYLNETLAKHYGIPGIAGPQWRRVEGVKKYGRGGILGLASVQAQQSGASRTSPVLRGNWVVETLLGERLPRPPADVPKLPEEETGNAGLTMRQLVAKHVSAKQCAVCHERIDPFGFALERYDAIGRWREKDLGGLAIDSKVTTRDGAEFEGIEGLRNYLLTKKRDVVVRLFCRKLLGYSLGRATGLSDQPLIDDMIADMNNQEGRLSAAVLAIVRSPQFRLIRGSEFPIPPSEQQP